MQHRKLDTLELIGEVARRKVHAAIDASPNETVLYSIEGLAPPVTRAVALALHKGIPLAEVKVHSTYDNGELPVHLLSDEPPAHWRNKARDEAKIRAIVFAADGRNIDTAGETIAAIRKLDMEILLDDVEAWMDACSFPLHRGDSERDFTYIRNALEGLTRTDLVLDLPMFARFVRRLAEEIDGKSVNSALDASLPEMRLPRDAGKFRPLSARGRIIGPAEWASAFAKIEKDTRNKLYLRNDRGVPLERVHLVKRTEELAGAGALDPEIHDAVVALTRDTSIEAGRWTPTQQAITELSWVKTSRVFALGRRLAQSLGAETIRFFEDEHPGQLSREEQSLLRVFSEAPGSDIREEEREFFFNNRELFRQNPRLYKRWEQAIFQQVGTHTDLLAGIVLSLKQLTTRIDELPPNPRLLIQLEGAQRLSFWIEDKNTSLCRFLKYRYRGLPKALGDYAVVDFGLCWGEENWERRLAEENASKSREATEFKLAVSLIDASAVGLTGVDAAALPEAPKVQFIWKLSGDSLMSGFAEDLHSIAAPPSVAGAFLLAGEFARNPKADKGQDQRIRLQDRNSILDAYDGSGGELFNPNNPAFHVGQQFLDQLDTLQKERMFGASGSETVSALRSAFLAFRSAYSRAVMALKSDDGAGLADPAFLEQGECYGALLQALRQHAAFPLAYQQLWLPILRVGVATNHGLPLAVVSPWQPLRLAELAIKALQVGDLIRAVFEESQASLGDIDTLFEVESAQFAASYYGDVALSSDESGNQLLAETERLADYSLLERAAVDDRDHDAWFDTPPKDAVDQFLYVAEQYLDIQPHERANFSCVLYNAESRDLPALLTDKLGRKIESESDLRCDLILTHDKPARLRRIYAQQNAAIGGELDAVLASEATRSFLSRLRVGFNDVNDVGGSGHRSPADLVLLQDVLSRRAELTWRSLEATDFPDLRTYKPTAWGRQCPFDPQEQSSAVYLTAPRLPEACQHFVDALRAVLKTDRESGPDAHFLPIRQINYSARGVRSILEKAHRIGDWVVTHDTIADRRLLEHSDIRIIRYLTRPGSEHKLIVSTQKPSQAIEMTLRDRIQFIEPTLNPLTLDAIIDQALAYAARLSGQVVLRAARNERSAMELLGLALTRSCIARAYGRAPEEMVWFFLDDYGSWLGHREGKVADILTLVPNMEGTDWLLDLVVAESKFVSESEWSASLSKAKKQLHNTVQGVRNRMLGEGVALERAIWQRRLADLLFEHTDPRQDFFGHPAKHWVDAVREGRLALRVRGGIYAFIYDKDGGLEGLDDENENLPDDQALYAFNRAETGQLLRALGGFETSLPACVPRWKAQAMPPSPEGRSCEWVSADDMTRMAVENPAEVECRSPASESDAERPLAHDQGIGVACVGELDASAGSVTMSPSRWPPPIERFIQSQVASTEDPESQAWLEDVTQRLKRALRNYQLDSRVIEKRLTPNAGLIKFAGSDNLTVDKVKRRQVEMKTSHSIDVIRVAAGLGEVIVMVSRPRRIILSLEQLWARRALPESAPELNLSLLLGEREDNGQLLYLNLLDEFAGQPDHAPHCLIGGESGSGKGVLVQNLLLDLCATNAPENLRIYMIDPKAGVDYLWLEHMPHLEGGLITDRERAIAILKELVEEMNRRYERFRDARAKKLSHYNRKVSRNDRLPFICLFHDEMTDWMLIPEYRDAVTTSVSQLATKARAAGIHLFFIAQRPDKDALPMQLRANLGNRLALKVADERNSKIILDEAGAEDLLGRGHLAAKLTGQGAPVLAQVPFLGEEQSEQLAAIIRDYWASRR